jgi:integrase
VEAVTLFLESCRSQETRNSYQLSFQKYMKFVGDDLFFDNNPRIIESKIIEFILSLRMEGKSNGAISNYLNAIKSFYKINDIVLNVHKINKFMPERMRVNKDRAYTHEEIGKLLEISDECMRVVILLLSSTGCRLGAVPSIRLRNIDKNKVTFYENTREEYFSFITPERQNAINAYTDIRSRYGEKLNDNSHLLREQFDYRDSLAIKNPRKVTDKLLRWKLMMMAEKCGIRKRGYDKT